MQGPTETAAGSALAIVTPLAREGDGALAHLQAVAAQLGADDAVFVVTDGATDAATANAVDAAAAADARIRRIHAPENRHVVDAYVAGYRAALAADFGWILEMDGGGSHRPAQIPDFRAAMASGADFAAGSRFLAGGSHRGSWRRYWISRGGTWLANRVLGTRMHDMTSGFQCFTRPALEFVLERGLTSTAHFFQTEIRFHLHGTEWVEVPIQYANPSSRVGSASLRDAWRCLWALRRRWGRAKPRGSGA